jgi:hypothetical protein
MRAFFLQLFLNEWRAVNDLKCYVSPVVFNDIGYVCISISLPDIASALNLFGLASPLPERTLFLQTCTSIYCTYLDHLTSGISALVSDSGPMAIGQE